MPHQWKQLWTQSRRLCRGKSLCLVNEVWSIVKTHVKNVFSFPDQVCLLRLQLKMLTQAFAQDMNGCQNIPSSLPQRERRQSQVTTATALLKATIWAEAILLQLLPLTISKTGFSSSFLVEVFNVIHWLTELSKGDKRDGWNWRQGYVCLECSHKSSLSMCNRLGSLYAKRPDLTQASQGHRSIPKVNHFKTWLISVFFLELLFWSLNLLLFNRLISQR